MSTKSVKKTTTTTSSSVSSSEKTQTPSTSMKTPARPSSPLSPTHISRLREKTDLQNLNDRLATYIDRVRELEQENNYLQVQIQRSEETVTKEVRSIKSMYEKELTDARRVLDETAKDKAKAEIAAGSLRAEKEELAAKLKKKEKDLAAAEKNADYYESKVQELQAKYQQALSDRKKFEDELKEYKTANEKQIKQLEDARKQLGEETLMRVDLENRLQSLKEELDFKGQVHEQQLIETQTRKQIEITKVDEQLQQQYKQMLADSLKELRDTYENQMRANREEMEHIYESKMNELKKRCDQNSGEAASAREEKRQVTLKLESTHSRLADLERENSDFTKKLKHLQQQMEDMRNAHQSILASRDDEIRQLKELLDQQFREYQDLTDVKIALDMEITAYRKLLESEEARLNIYEQHQSSQQLRRSTPGRRTPTGVRGIKRKRTMMSEESMSRNYVSSSEAKGDVEVSDQDVEGKYIKVHNKGDKDVAVGGWQVIRRVGDKEMNYKFHRSIHCKAGQTITVWSSKENVTHSPPSDLVMKGQNWHTGEDIHTLLLNNDGEEVASRETKREIASTGFYRMSEGGYLEDVTEEGDGQNPERCSIM